MSSVFVRTTKEGKEEMIKDYVCVDIETTGCRVKWDKIIEIGAVKVRNRKVVEVFSELINPGVEIPVFITELTGITNEMVENKDTIEKVFSRFMEFAGDDVLMGHNIMFDYSFLKQNAVNLNIEFEKNGVDTLKIARKALPELDSRGLSYLCRHFGILDENHHRAFNDAECTSKLYWILADKFAGQYPEKFKAVQLLYNVKKLQHITPRQKKYLIDLMEYHKIEKDFDIDSISKNEASKKIDKILSENGRIFDF